MHHAIDFIQDLAVIMLIAGIVTVTFNRFKQPVVLGYIVAGVIIGPYTPPFSLIHDEQTINTLAELGVVFLLFSLGLEFSLRKLARVGVTAIVAALSEIVLMIWLGYEIGRWFGWKPMDALFLAPRWRCRRPPSSSRRSTSWVSSARSSRSSSSAC